MEFALRHPPYDLSTTFRCSSEQPFDFTMHYNGHRKSTYVIVNLMVKSGLICYKDWILDEIKVLFHEAQKHCIRIAKVADSPGE